MAEPAPAEHFADLGQQAHAARLGMWVFLGSELLFFGALFSLYVSARVEHPAGFDAGVSDNTVILGSINTGVLLVSSFTVATAVHELRRARIRAAAALTGVTVALGLVFLVIKFTEYGIHFSEDLYPGGVGHYFVEHTEPGLPLFFTLYYAMTGLHALHVAVGMGVLSVLLVKVLRGRITPAAPHALALGAVYWHLVDVIWIFLWPLFYLVVESPR